MKTKVISLISMFLLGATMLFAQAKTEKFEVKGKCGMCETRIEKAAKSVEGVNEADWNLKTHMLEVSFDESETSLDEVQKAIAKVGHDTPMHKASKEVYDALPGCCKYDRIEMKDDKKHHNHHKEHKH
ncbi:heavy-metal-associated domain-containing protein [Balneicella halophila]|uniref:Heavy-metal-associated domain-containing protein n=1 Tax=Balneicella halophila TaxID=1537566 RepID=A0A7L4UQZ9_BALHA|nr:heavy metal-associated domain-containing protein [Balneicella halophila]PVX51942.1 heavy-metal-associated domain-containing protein [Balneicella halophila]